MQTSGAQTDNVAAFRQIVVDIINDGRIELCERLMASDFKIHRFGLAATSRLLGSARPTAAGLGGGHLDGFKNGLAMLRAAFPDWSHTIKWVVAQDDCVAGVWTLNCTHLGVFMGVPPTGQKISMDETGFMRFRNGQMVEGWFMGDELALVQQLGVKVSIPSASIEVSTR